MCVYHFTLKSVVLAARFSIYLSISRPLLYNLYSHKGLYSHKASMTGQTAPGGDFPASWPNLGASGPPLADPLADP